MEHINYFQKKIDTKLKECGIPSSLKRYDDGCLAFVFFFEDFEVFNKLHHHIEIDYSIDLFRQEDMACLRIYVKAFEHLILQEYERYLTLLN